MPAYLPKTFTISSFTKGSFTPVASKKLSVWPRTIATGVVKTSTGTNIPNAGILLYSILSVGQTVYTGSYLGMTFTDAAAHYAVSLGVNSIYGVAVIAPPLT